jgi:hypothetical protein
MNPTGMAAQEAAPSWLPGFAPMRAGALVTHPLLQVVPRQLAPR